MKKILISTMLLITLLTPTYKCFAADWYWVASSGVSTHYIDKNSGRWDGSYLTCSEKLVKLTGDYMLGNITYDYGRYPQLYVRRNQIWAYNADGSFLGSEKNYKWNLIPPDSIGETIALKAFALFESRLPK